MKSCVLARLWKIGRLTTFRIAERHRQKPADERGHHIKSVCIYEQIEKSMIVYGNTLVWSLTSLSRTPFGGHTDANDGPRRMDSTQAARVTFYANLPS